MSTQTLNESELAFLEKKALMVRKEVVRLTDIARERALRVGVFNRGDARSPLLSSID